MSSRSTSCPSRGGLFSTAHGTRATGPSVVSYREPTYDQVVSAALQFVGPSLKRNGVQGGQPRYKGPCPICGGRDRFRVAQGDRAVLIQCSHDCTYRDLLDALELSHTEAQTQRRERAPAVEPARAVAPGRNPWLDDVWIATVAADNTPGACYLVEHRAVWLAGRRLPPGVRWLPDFVADELHVRRDDWPNAAAGCLVYLLGAADDSDTWALKVEAIAEDGKALPFVRDGKSIKRPSLSGSLTDSGRRTLRAGGDSGHGIHLVEGPIDALALLTLEALGLCDLRGAAVLGADGIGGFTERACEGNGPVVLYPDGARKDARDRWIPDAEAKATRLAQALELAGRGRVRIERQPRGRDLADAARDAVMERRAIQTEG